MSISVKRRWEIVFLSTHTYGPKLSQRKVASIVKVSVLTVQFWLKRYKETEDVEEIVKTGRPRVTSPIQDQRIISQQERDREATAGQIRMRLRFDVSEGVIRDRVAEAGFKFAPPLVKPPTTSISLGSRTLSN